MNASEINELKNMVQNWRNLAARDSRTAAELLIKVLALRTCADNLEDRIDKAVAKAAPVAPSANLMGE